MPSHARKEIVRMGEVGIYHVWSRCVQRAMLCGVDPVTEQDFNHRRAWLETLIEYQASVFAVDVGSYSILGNHFHLICRTRPDIAQSWPDEEVAWRWRMAWPNLGRDGWQRSPTDVDIEELLQSSDRIAQIRDNLGNLSWFLARIKEPIAKRCNAEAKRKGHFFEARFGSRELTSDEEILGCTLYVDLNQIKAGVADSLESSDHSAIQLRLQAQQRMDQHVHSAAELSHDAFHAQTHHAPQYAFSVKQAESLFAGCWLAPMSDQAELATTEAIRLQAKREPDEQSQSAQAQTVPTNAEPTADAKASPKDAQRRSVERRGARTWRRHRRLLKKRLPRASNVSILPLPVSQYLSLARRFAKRLLGERTAVATERHDELHDASPSNWRQDTRNFTNWFYQALTETTDDLSARVPLLGRLMQVRGDPPAAATS